MATAKLDISASGLFNKAAKDILSENETTVTVNYTGGGQDLKKRKESSRLAMKADTLAAETPWTYDSMLAAALKFPSLVAKTPMRTHAVLTRYTSLKSFFTLGPQFSPMSYEHAGNYAAALQEAYLDYKNIAKDIQVLAFDVLNGVQILSSRDNVSAQSELAIR